ncbi:MAG: GerAB/ArcD/ProY family transporter [Clostridia bacterium]|nr:GerAB/ArcD/ProY family transporter [Clostridia bacterium]
MIGDNNIKIKQLMLLIILIIPGGKYLSLPIVMARGIGRDSPYACLILFAIDLLMLLCIVWALNLNTYRKSVYEIISSTLSPIVAKIIMGIFALFLLVRLSYLMVYSIDIFSSTFSIKTNWLAFIIPVAIAVIFMISRGMTAVARLAQILFAFIIIAQLTMLILSIPQTDIGNLQPVLDKGIGGVLRKLPDYTLWYGDCLILLFFADCIPKNEEKYGILVAGFGISAAICIGLSVVYIGLFGSYAKYNNLAMSKVSQFIIQQTTLGRLDWLMLVIWSVSVLIKIVMFSFCCMRSINHILNITTQIGKYISLIAVMVIIVVLPLLTDVKQLVSDAFSTGWGKYVFWVCQYLLPPLLPLLVCRTNKREQADNNIILNSKSKLKKLVDGDAQQQTNMADSIMRGQP